MRELPGNETAFSRSRPRIGLLLAVAMFATALLWTAAQPEADAKGPVKIRICGEDGCVRKKSPRLTAAMFYGGRSHDGPGCAARVHRATVNDPGSVPRAERYIVAASRGLIGRQGKGGYVWWRKVRGWKKSVLTAAVRPTGKGFLASPDLTMASDLNQTSRNAKDPWRLTSSGLTCATAGDS